MQRKSRFPHLSILDRVFVETVGGNLTIKIEDNTDTDEGIYTELVDNNQSLDDAEFSYADLGNLILLRIKPYQEPQYRYFVFNDKLKQVQCIDKIEEACILLPDTQGLIFSNGYYLQNGELKVFDNLIEHLRFEKKVAAPNSEDFLYVFHNDYDGVYVLFAYNLIAQKVDSPIACNGFSLFNINKGELVYFRKSTEPSKNHQLQIWQSPFVSPDYVSPTPNDSFLHKIGNKDLVRGMAECSEVLNLLAKEQVYATLYQDLVQKCTTILDFYYWVNHPETFEMHLPLLEIKQTAMATIDEFEKVQSLQKNTARQIAEVQQKVKQSLENIKRTIFDSVEKFVDNLSLLRTLCGECIALKDLRYTQPETIADMEVQIVE